MHALELSMSGAESSSSADRWYALLQITNDAITLSRRSLFDFPDVIFEANLILQYCILACEAIRTRCWKP
jgi:hypothetical protein